MKQYLQVVRLMVALVVLLSVGFVHAKNQKSERPMKKSQRSMPEMSPEEKAKMDEYMKLSTPNENHRVLDALVGKWNHTVRWQMTADAKPEESKGTNVNRWIFGNRFLKQEVHGKTSMGQPFEGMGITGYDLMKKQYTNVWFDNMATGIMTANASYDAANKTFNEMGTFSCPMTGEKNRAYRAVMKIVDKDHYTYDMYVKDPNGKEFKSLEIAYARTKQAKVSKR